MPAPGKLIKSNWSRAMAGVVVVVVVLLAGLIMTLLFGMVQGEEFSPAGFQRRTFFYYQFPFLGGQLSPVFRSYPSNPLESYLRAKKLVGVPSKNARWDVVFRSTIFSPPQLGSAHELSAFLDMQNEKGDSLWLNWSKQYPKLADVLWPYVAAMAQEKSYFAVPEMMNLATANKDANELRDELSQIAEHTRNLVATRGPETHKIP